MTTLIFDIDGTLADCDHRRHHITGGRRDWDGFFATMADDPVIEPIRRLAELASRSGAAIVLCSGRPEKYRTVTEEWLRRSNVPFEALYMRAEGDFRADYIVKAQLLDGIRKDGHDPLLVIDDRQTVVDMWRENGLVCLQCRPSWEDEPASAPGLLTVMVGPTGAGKTTWLAGVEARALYGIHPSHILSSDQIRADLCGDFREQSRNDDVFAALHGQAKARLRHGLPVVIDATNLRRKDRMTAALLAPANGSVRYLVLNRPLPEKYRDAGWRAEVTGGDGKPFDLIAKHEQTFNSQLCDILGGDGLPNVTVSDLRVTGQRSVA